ncbi:MAG: mannose-1-phosphate guanylyltransferase, partial [Nannocystaceae bacterium]
MSEPATLAIIMAGGAGTRLWPASHADRPKHIIPGLGAGGASLLQSTLDRIAPIIPAANVRIVTTEAQVDPILAAAPSLTRAQMIVEPEGKNTAPCLALVAAVLEANTSPDTTLCILPADHAVADRDAFLRSLSAACDLATARDTICTLGIRPTSPSTGYGYMQHRDAPLPAVAEGGPAAHEVIRFTEKPDAATAAEFLTSGDYVWNAGIFVTPLGRLLRDLRRHCASTLTPLQTALAETSEGGNPNAAIARAYASVEAAPIDIALMEKLDDLCVVRCDAGW